MISVVTGLAGILFLVVVAGCGGTASQGGASQGGITSEPSGKIILYTSEPQKNADEFVAEFKKDHPNIDVQVFRSGTGKLVAKLEAEEKAGSVQADVLLAADASTFEKFKAKNLFLKYTPPEAGKIDAQFKDPDGYYTGTRLISTIIGYNTNLVKDPPKSWRVLTDPQYQGKIGMPSPDYSGAAAYNIALWASRPELGWGWIEKLVQNKPTVVEGNGQVQQGIASGQFPTGIIIDYMVRDLQKKGSPVAGVFPSEGVPAITEPVAIFKSSKNQEAAKVFVNYLVSKQGQDIAVKQNYVPIRPDVKSPEGAPSISEIKVMSGNLQQLTADQKAAKERFNGLLKAGG
ncbi:MAG: ABC transporter substrate-binding protein [Thermoleophilia bacterium]